MTQREKAIRLIADKLPSLAGNTGVYDSLLRFFDDTALINTDLGDLQAFLRGECLYRVIKTNGKTLYECALDLVDNHPECTSARGMLRYYEAGPEFWWGECEQAETVLGNALTLDIYDWSPDSFTLFNDVPKGHRRLVAILAFD